MQTGENEQGLRKIMDFTRLLSISILALHCYFYCYTAFKQWDLTSTITDRLLYNFSKTGLITGFIKPKLLALVLLIISVMGQKGKKNQKIQYQNYCNLFHIRNSNLLFIYCMLLVNNLRKSNY